MVPLGLQMTTIGSLGGPGMMGDPGGSAARPQNFWECEDSASGFTGNITPLPLGFSPGAIDSNDMWDFADSDGHYMPQLSSTHVAEGFWEPDPTDVQGNIRPILDACS